MLSNLHSMNEALLANMWVNASPEFKLWWVLPFYTYVLFMSIYSTLILEHFKFMGIRMSLQR